MKMRKPGKHAFLAVVAALLFQPGAAQAVINLCNSSAGEMGLSVVLEDPNLRLFTRYPYTSRGMYVLQPAQCGEISMGRSEGMRVHFQTYYRAEDGSWQPGEYDVRNTREVKRSGRRFCTHDDHSWDLSREEAVKCRAGYVLADFGYKLVVPMNAKDYRLSLTANRPPPSPSTPAPAPTPTSSGMQTITVGERLDDAEKLDSLLKDGLAGKECHRDKNVVMRYLKNEVSVTPQGILRARVENWHKGKLTSSNAGEVRIQDIASVKQGKNRDCTILDLKCNKYLVSEKARLGQCVKSTSLGTSKSLRLYFPSKADATGFRKLVLRNTAEQTPPDSAQYGRLPDGRTVLRPLDAEQWVLERGEILERRESGLVILTGEELALSGTMSSVEKLEKELERLVGGRKCKVSSFPWGDVSRSYMPGGAIKINNKGIVTATFTQSGETVKETTVIDHLSFEAGALDSKRERCAKIPCRKGFSERGKQDSYCVVITKSPEEMVSSGALLIPINDLQDLSVVKRLLRDAAANFE